MDDIEKKSTEKLDNEKAMLEDKVKKLSKIIEIMSAKTAEKAPAKEVKAAVPEAAGQNLKQNFEELKDSISSLEKKIKTDRKSKSSDEIKNIFSTIQEKITALDTIPGLVESMKRIEENLKKDEEAAGAQSLFGGFGSFSGGRESSMYFSELKSAFEEFRETSELKLEDMERRLNILAVKLDTKTLKNLEQLASSKDEILNKMIPIRVREEVDKILSALSYSLNSINQQVHSLIMESEKINSKISLSMELIERFGRRMERMEGGK